MKIAIRYYSKTGNTQKLAVAIQDVLGVEARRTVVPLTEDVDILFLGSSVYAGKVDHDVKTFFEKNTAHIGTIVSFSTAALMTSTYKQIKKLAEDHKIHLCSREFHCKGSLGPIHSGRPSEIDLKEVAAFALDTVNFIQDRSAATSAQ